MKAQGLTISTIVIIVMVVVTLVAVLLLFYGGMGGGKESVNQQQIYAKCQNLCLRLQQGGITCSTYRSTLNAAGVDCCKYLSCEGITCCSLAVSGQPCSTDAQCVSGSCIDTDNDGDLECA